MRIPKIPLFLCTLIMTLLASKPMLYGQNFDSHLRSDSENTFRVVLDPRYRATLSAQVSSSVKEIPKEMGEHFNAGDTLVRLDSSIFQANLKKARILLERASEQLNAKQALYADNVASAFELKAAQAEVAAAELDLTTAIKELESCTIQAPYQGHLDNVLVNPHEVIQAGQPLVEVVHDTTLLAKLLIPSRFFNKIRSGQRLQLKIMEIDESVEAIITHIGSVIDPASSMMKVFAEVDNREGKLRAGMTGITTITE